jgi:molecular chaperone GrpE
MRRRDTRDDEIPREESDDTLDGGAPEDTAPGTPNDDADEAGETGDTDREGAESEDTDAPTEPVTEMVPAWLAREWERRALEAEGKIREITDAYRRHKHELDATRERLARDQEVRVLDALSSSFSKILEAIDALDLALAHAEPGPLVEGVELVKRKILDALEAEGVTRIDAVGHPFDPSFAEAVSIIPTDDDAKNNVVVAELRAGYKLRDRVLRPAQVQVSQKS